MLLVYSVDETTRLVMPNSQWAMQVLKKLAEMGHAVQVTGQDPDSLFRDSAELARRDQLLESTGL